jgi:hypothetical protein
MTFGNEDIHEGAVKIGVIVQYWLVLLLCLGALVSTLFALSGCPHPSQRIVILSLETTS